MSRQDKSIELKEVNAEDKETEEGKSMAGGRLAESMSRGQPRQEPVRGLGWNALEMRLIII